MLNDAVQQLFDKNLQQVKHIMSRIFKSSTLVTTTNQRTKQESHVNLLQLKNGLAELETLLVQMWNLDRVIAKKKDPLTQVAFDTCIKNNNDGDDDGLAWMQRVWIKMSKQWMDDFHQSLQRMSALVCHVKRLYHGESTLCGRISRIVTHVFGICNQNGRIYTIFQCV